MLHLDFTLTVLTCVLPTKLELTLVLCITYVYMSVIVRDKKPVRGAPFSLPYQKSTHANLKKDKIDTHKEAFFIISCVTLYASASLLPSRHTLLFAAC